MIAVVATADIGTTSTPVTTFNVPSLDVAHGDCLVVYIRTGNTVTVSTISDTAGNTFTLEKTASEGTTVTSVYVAQNCKANASDVVQVVFSGAIQFTNVVVYQVSGASTTNAFDNATSATSATNVSSLSPEITTAQANSLIIAFTQEDASPATITFPNGWTARGASPTGGDFVNAAYNTFTSIQTNLVVESSFGTAGTGIAILVALRQAGAGSGGGCSKTWGNFSF